MNLIFLGAPGAGKGTQAETLARLWQIAHISTGDLLRQAIAAQTSLGLQAKKHVDAGELVPDSLVIDLMRERMSQPDAKRGWILDGFPRNLSQAQALEQLLQIMAQPYGQVINFNVSTEVLIQRMLGRGRRDDNEATIRRRLEVYQEKTVPLIEYYQRRRCLTEIDGNPPENQVAASLDQVVRSLVPS